MSSPLNQSSSPSSSLLILELEEELANIQQNTDEVKEKPWRDHLEHWDIVSKCNKRSMLRNCWSSRVFSEKGPELTLVVDRMRSGFEHKCDFPKKKRKNTGFLQGLDRGPGWAGYAEWKSETSSEVCLSLDARIQDVSSSVPL